jgi:hypothetical protein
VVIFLRERFLAMHKLCTASVPHTVIPEDLRGCGCILPVGHEREHLSETSGHLHFAWSLIPTFSFRRIHLDEWVEIFSRERKKADERKEQEEENVRKAG